jgi:hypothetical protein
MKFSLSFIVAISGMSAFGSPAARTNQGDIIQRSPATPREPDVENSVIGARSPDSLAASDAMAWACIYIDSRNFNSGSSYGATEAQARTAAIKTCEGDCRSSLCITGGCIAWAAGKSYAQVSTASGNGSAEKDALAAEGNALAGCEALADDCEYIFGFCTSNAQ